jgi:uncharacterized membrane protein
VSPRPARPPGLLQRARGALLTGLVIILPLIITLWLLGLLFRMVEATSSPFILSILQVVRPELADEPAIVRFAVPVVGILLTFVLIMVVGALTTNLLGQRIVDAFDRLMMRLPLVKSIYGAARQLLDAFSRKNGSFRRVVLVEYPRPGVYTLGFLTQSGAELTRQDGPPLRGCSLVFLPTSPNPTSGWLALLPDDKVVPLEMSIEDGVKLIVSGGLVMPEPPQGGAACSTGS